MTRHTLFARLCDVADALQPLAQAALARDQATRMDAVLDSLDGLIDDVVDGPITESDPPLSLRDLEARAHDC